MAEVAMPTMARHHRHTSSINSMNATALPQAAPKIEMRANPDFTFPMQPQGNPTPAPKPTASLRPRSMHLDSLKAETPSSTGRSRGHRKAASALPTFSFNQQDASGLKDSPSPPVTPTDIGATPARKGHKRGGSEFVGGDSRLGVTSAMSSSPTKTNALPVPSTEPIVAPPGPPSGRRHGHKRSIARSSHDVTEFMKPAEAEPQLSSSLPNSPLYHPCQTHAPPLEQATTATAVSEENNHSLPSIEIDDTSDRPGSQRQVGFSDTIEIIPGSQRPLSTISSETESSIGHSHNNSSISSMLSLSSSSPPSQRAQRPLLSTMPEDEPGSKPRNSAEISGRTEKEGEWLRSVSAPNLQKPHSESATTPTSIKFAEQDHPQATPRTLHRKRHSLGHALGFDRRKSEPSIATHQNLESRLSAISLEDISSARQTVHLDKEHCDAGHRLSTSKIKNWAIGKISRKPKDHNAQEADREEAVARPRTTVHEPARAEVPVAETDLDAVFGNQNSSEPMQRVGTQSEPVYEFSAPTSSQYPWSGQTTPGDSSPVVDLDAALGPLRTPPMAAGSHRRQLHSSRGAKDFGGGFGGTHQRALSLPVLTPFENPARIGTPQSSMADVFEEDEEEESKTMDSRGQTSKQQEEPSMGVSVVDSDNSQPMKRKRSSFGEGLGIQSGGWEMERPSTSHGPSSQLSTPINLDRRASLVEETIIEEASPVESPQAQNKRIEVVAEDQEPRASSLTKSSDSSETPTLLAPQPSVRPTVQTPEAYQPSNFSSSDFARRHGSLEASRTTASSITDNRTAGSSNYVSDQSSRISVDDVPSLTSSRSTMMSNILAHNNNSRRDFSDRSTSVASVSTPQVQDFADANEERKKKRSSIQSLSQLMGGSFHGKYPRGEETRPQTADLPAAMEVAKPKKQAKETGGHPRLKKLMFWKNKHGDTGSAKRHRSVSGM